MTLIFRKSLGYQLKNIEVTTDPGLLNAVCHGTDGIFHQAVWFYCFRAFGESCPLSKVDKGMKVGTVVPMHDELKPGTLHGFSGLRR